MPGRDGTGPLGQGPLTGRGLGRCRKHRDIANISREEQRKILQSQLEQLEREKENIIRKINELKD
ncbi:MAG: DUF5320 domain-containing protein [Candidatus Aenigmatarchaeota archaeon]|nr:DUF5320 domain-containing protein [Candidatus Aenigmarchaeota archaeon]